MFLLRRKSDGKFFRNRDYHSCIRGRYGEERVADPEWTDDITLCKPFKSLAGAMNSRGVNLSDPNPLPPLTRDSTQEERNAYWEASMVWWAKENRPVRVALFHQKYELVPVTLTLEVSK